MLYYGLEQHSLDSYFQFKELGSAPSTPTSNEIRLYAKDDGSGVSTLCYKNDAGTEICLPSSGSIVTGTGVSGRLAIWNGTSTLTSDSDLTFSVDTLTATKIIAPTSITISTLTSGSVVFAGASGLLSQNNAQLFWDNSNIRLGIGGTPSFDLDVQSVSGVMSLLRSSADATPPNANLRKSRGTIAVPVKVNSADKLGNLVFQGHDGSAFATGAFIQALTAENWGTTAHGTSLLFNTTPTGSITTAEVFRIGPSGQWGIGGATFGTAGQYFRSGGASAAPTWATIDHNTELANVASGDVHTQYALLAGRSGGQTLDGDTASGGNLTLSSTAHATKGKIIFGTGAAIDETNGRISLGDTNASVNGVGVSHDGTAVVNISSAGAGPFAAFIARSSRGTIASPSQILNGDTLFQLEGRGASNSGFNSAGATLTMAASENHTATAWGTGYQFKVIPTGTTTAVAAILLTSQKSVIIGDSAAALATTATDGFLYIPSCAGAPTGTPTSFTGVIPIVYDTTNNKLYIYNGGWKTTTVFA